MYYLFYNTGNILFKETIMEDKQRVYIKGDRNRGNEIIKLLEDLGGVNSWSYAGTDEESLYYINPRGNIEYIYDYEFLPECLLVKEFYREIELPEIKKWKPKYNENYYRINGVGEVAGDIWYNTQIDESFYKFGNCFRTKKEAEAVRDKIKNFLNNDK